MNFCKYWFDLNSCLNTRLFSWFSLLTGPLALFSIGWRLLGLLLPLGSTFFFAYSNWSPSFQGGYPSFMGGLIINLTFWSILVPFYFSCGNSIIAYIYSHIMPNITHVVLKFLCQDSANSNGGKWIIRFKKAVSGRFWEDLVREKAEMICLLLCYCFWQCNASWNVASFVIRILTEGL